MDDAARRFVRATVAGNTISAACVGLQTKGTYSDHAGTNRLTRQSECVADCAQRKTRSTAVCYRRVALHMDAGRVRWRSFRARLLGHHQEEECAQKHDNVSNPCRENKTHEVLVVPPPHTVPHPWAVVIKDFHTVVTRPTVMAPRRLIYLARGTLPPPSQRIPLRERRARLKLN